MSTEPTIVAVSVGNSRSAVGRFASGRLEIVERFDNADLDAIVDEVADDWRALQGADEVSILLASVNDRVADPLEAAIKARLNAPVYRLERDLPVPIGRKLDPETIVGVDRLLNAAAAYDRLKQACVIVDAGTAVTIDFIDGEGTFHGGAIAPGAAMQLRSMHTDTALLPEVPFRRPDPEPFGANTAQAMLHGVYYGIRGMVRHLTERYAEAYEAYPMVIATGGDAHVLFDQDDLVERIVDDLALMGIAVAARYALAERDDEP